MSSCVRGSALVAAPFLNPLNPSDTEPTTILPMRMMPMTPEIAIAPMPIGFTKVAKILPAPMAETSWVAPANSNAVSCEPNT